MGDGCFFTHRELATDVAGVEGQVRRGSRFFGRRRRAGNQEGRSDGDKECHGNQEKGCTRRSWLHRKMGKSIISSFPD